MNNEDVKIIVSFKRGLRPDGEIESMTVKQDGYGEIRLTRAQAASLAKEIKAIRITGLK